METTDLTPFIAAPIEIPVKAFSEQGTSKKTLFFPNFFFKLDVVENTFLDL